MRKFLILVGGVILSLAVNAQQREASNWLFGNYAWVNFNNNPATIVNGSALFSSEGCASISDPNTGALLFYTDGSAVYNANHVLMAGSPPGGIGGNDAAAQSALIVKRPGPGNLYFIFVNPIWNPFSPGNLSYTLINMNGNGGLGSVVSHNNFMMQGTSERLSAISSCDGSSYWIISHAENTDEFMAWKLTNTGLSLPVISSIGNPLFPAGNIKFSPSRLKVAITESSLETYLLDFDPTNGQFSNMIALNTPGYGVEFSPDSRKLYVTQGDTSAVWQFNLTNPSPAAILASKTNISTSFDGYAWGIQGASNGRIYIAKYLEDSLDMISNPNAPGAACGYIANSLALDPYNTEVGLPNYPVNYITDQRQRTYAKLIHNLCVGVDTVFLELKDLGNNPTFSWNFGNPSSPNNTLVTTNVFANHTFSAQGTYTVKVVGTGPCGTDSATAVVSTGQINLDAGPSAEICQNDGHNFNIVSNPAFQPLTITWNPSSSLTCSNCPSPYATPTITTVYTVTTSIGVCNETDTATITVRPRPNLVVSPKDTIFCVPGTSINYTATGADTVTWAPVTFLSCFDCPSPIAQPLTSITYTVTGNNQYNCPTTRTVTATVAPLTLNVVPLITDSFCVTNTIFVSGSATGAGVKFFWDFGDGTTKLGNAANHKYNTAGVYTISLIAEDTLGCKDTISRRIFVDALAAPYFEVNDSIICIGEKIFVTDTMHPYAIGFTYSYGDTRTQSNERNPEILYESPGVYILEFKNDHRRCPDKSFSKQIQVRGIDPPRLGKDTAICPDLTGAISLPPIGTSLSGSKFKWSTGATSNFILVQEPGEYWVEVVDGDSSCVTADTILITADCYINIPNSFTPDGDGLNDKFIPMDLASKGVVSYTCNIFNRWGERLFTTNNLQSDGWDGKFGGVDQPIGVYIYDMKVVFRSGKVQKYTGNVTLLR